MDSQVNYIPIATGIGKTRLMGAIIAYLYLKK